MYNIPKLLNLFAISFGSACIGHHFNSMLLAVGLVCILFALIDK